MKKKENKKIQLENHISNKILNLLEAKKMIHLNNILNLFLIKFKLFYFFKNILKS